MLCAAWQGAVLRNGLHACCCSCMLHAVCFLACCVLLHGWPVRGGMGRLVLVVVGLWVVFGWLLVVLGVLSACASTGLTAWWACGPPIALACASAGWTAWWACGPLALARCSAPPTNVGDRRPHPVGIQIVGSTEVETLGDPIDTGVLPRRHGGSPVDDGIRRPC